MRARVDRRERLGRGHVTGAGDHPGGNCRGNDGSIGRWRHDQPPARGMNRIDLTDRHHGPRADQRPAAKPRTQPRYVVERIGRIERHLDDSHPALDQSLANRLDLVGPDPTQDRDQRALRKQAVELVERIHCSVLAIASAPARPPYPDATSPLPAIIRAYSLALSLGVRVWVSKSTWTIPKRLV